MVDEVPSTKQVDDMEYSYRPCLLNAGPYPIDPQVFMHWFLDSGDHADDPSMAVERLPKKQRTPLEHQPGGLALGRPPVYWGIYIVDGLNWARIQVALLAFLLVPFLVSVIWSATKNNVQGGMGIGQYSIALVVACLTVSLLGFTTLEGLTRGPEYRK